MMRSVHAMIPSYHTFVPVYLNSVTLYVYPDVEPSFLTIWYVSHSVANRTQPNPNRHHPCPTQCLSAAKRRLEAGMGRDRWRRTDRRNQRSTKARRREESMTDRKNCCIFPTYFPGCGNNWEKYFVKKKYIFVILIIFITRKAEKKRIFSNSTVIRIFMNCPRES